MPRCIFKLLWDTVQAGQEIFAYVINRSKNGDHYWVYAHITPSFEEGGKICGYHSNRRAPDRTILDKMIIPLYSDLIREEEKHSNRKSGLAASESMIANLLSDRGLAYDEFIATL